MMILQSLSSGFMTVYTILKLESRAIIFTAEIDLILEEAVSVLQSLSWIDVWKCWDIMGQIKLQQN